MPAPAQEIEVQAGLNIKRTFTIQHPAKPLLNDARCCQWNKVTRTNITSIAVGTVGDGTGFVNDGDLMSGLMQEPGTAESDDTTSYNHYLHIE
jgi:hypothetical protein